MHKVLNFGSVLQAYCTCSIIKRFGFEPEIINYMEPRHTHLGAIKNIIFDVFDDVPMWKIPAQIAVGILKIFSYFIQRIKFSRFLSQYLPIGSRKYFSLKHLVRNPPQADIYMSGSDQVWNSGYNNGVDRAYFLDFVPAKTPKFSYASSFGKDKIIESEAHKIRDLLKTYRAISVREASAVQIISKLGISGASHVLDPTLLLSCEEWEHKFNLNDSPENKPYLLIYTVERSLDGLVYKFARKVANSLGLQIVFLSQAAKLYSMKECECQRSFSSVHDFLRYFYNANFIIASSFHGLAFSINFEKQFAVVLPPKYESRLVSLLDVVGLSKRIVSNDINLDPLREPIDYSIVSRLIDRERQKSLDYLKLTLNSCQPVE